MADQESTAQIELLDQNLRKTHVLSARMTAILAQFDTRLNRLERTIVPLHTSTQAGARLQTNLDRTLAALSSVTEQSASSRSTSSRLLSPPTSLSGPPSELASFLSALDGVLARSADLRSAGLAGAQAELTTNAALADRAFASLCRLAAGAVREGTPASPPDFRTAAARARTGEERQVDEQAILPTAGTLRASGVVAYLASCALVGSPAGRKEWDGVWRVWSALRGEWLRSGVALSPSLSSAAADEHAGSPTAADPTSQLLVGYLAHASAERALLLSLFPSSHPPAATLLPQLLAPSLTAVQALLQAHVQQLKRVAFPWRAYALSSTLSSLAPSWAAFFHNPPSAGGAQGADLLLAVDPGPAQSQLAKSLRGVCLRSVPEAVERAKVPGPRAGEQPAVGVSPTVTETVAYLLALPAHAHTLTGFLTALGDRKWLMGAAPVPLERDAGEPDLLEHFVYDVVGALVSSLDARARALRPGVAGVFLVNNMTFVRDAVLLNAPAEVGELLGPAAEDLLNGAFRSAKATYLQPFADLARPLDTLTPSTPRQTAKDVLTRFWDSLDALDLSLRPPTAAGSIRLSTTGSGGAVRDRLKDDVRKLVGGSYEGCVGRLRGALGVKYVRLPADELGARVEALVR